MLPFHQVKTWGKWFCCCAPTVATWTRNTRTGTRKTTFPILNLTLFDSINVKMKRVLHLAMMSNKSDEAIGALVEKGASLNALNDEMRSPLFLSVLANNPLGASALIKLNADYTLKDKSGKFAFESVKEIGEWMSTGLFDENTKRALKGNQFFRSFSPPSTIFSLLNVLLFH